MKKTIILCLTGVLMAVSLCVTLKTLAHQSDDLFTMNLEALARNDIVGSGSCWKIENDCMLRCPGCGNLVYATTGDLGPFKVYNCSCGYHYTNYNI